MISIILPTYNSAHTIARAVRSVLAQTYTDWELLVIDDGSTDDTDGTVKALTDPRIIYIKQEQNLGLQKTLNHGLALAKGEYIARIDADDFWNDPDKLQTQVSFLDAHRDHVLVGTGIITIDANGRELTRTLLPETDQDIRERILGKNCFAHSSVLFRKGVDRYSEDISVRHAEDYDLWMRLGLAGSMANIAQYMTTLTVTPSTVTARNRVAQAKRILAIAYKYRNKYPHAISGIAIASMRYMFFWFIQYIPFPKKLLYWIQKAIRSL